MNLHEHPNQHKLDELKAKMEQQYKLIGEMIEFLFATGGTHRDQKFDEVRKLHEGGGLTSLTPVFELAELIAEWEPTVSCQAAPWCQPALIMAEDGIECFVAPSVSDKAIETFKNYAPFMQIIR